jgi:uncharacterized protein (DUF697 family)
MEIVRVHTILSVTANFVPVPILGSVIISGIQLQMAADLARHYSAGFDPSRARAIFAAAGAGLANEIATQTSLASSARAFILSIPVLGQPLRLLGWPLLLAAYTHVLGEAYVRHYEAGGRFADFDPARHLQSPFMHGSRAGRQ